MSSQIGITSRRVPREIWFKVQKMFVKASSIPQVREVEREIENFKPSVVVAVGGGSDIGYCENSVQPIRHTFCEYSDSCFS